VGTEDTLGSFENNTEGAIDNFLVGTTDEWEDGEDDCVWVGSSDGADEMDGIYVGNFEGTYEGMIDDVGNEDKLGVSDNENEGIIDDLLEGFADE